MRAGSEGVVEGFSSERLLVLSGEEYGVFQCGVCTVWYSPCAGRGGGLRAECSAGPGQSSARASTGARVAGDGVWRRSALTSSAALQVRGELSEWAGPCACVRARARCHWPAAARRAPPPHRAGTVSMPGDERCAERGPRAAATALMLRRLPLTANALSDYHVDNLTNQNRYPSKCYSCFKHLC